MDEIHKSSGVEFWLETPWLVVLVDGINLNNERSNERKVTV